MNTPGCSFCASGMLGDLQQPIRMLLLLNGLYPGGGGGGGGVVAPSLACETDCESGGGDKQR